jgi:23S rRNA (guanosine2251-2'-O)-methyltransferase
VAKKPAWIIDKERGRKAAAAETFWLFGMHAVRDALANPAREKLRLVVTRNALDRLGEAIAAAGLTPEIADPRKFPVPLDPGSVHQGAALEVRALDWGGLTISRLRTGRGRRAWCFWTGCRTRITWVRSCARPRSSAPAR